ncbi:hypothetical protein SAMN05444680_12081 [Variovorax sp. YR216]|nr:hypothetical protein SAMN05444680_12081 [Variovorax sp. YR216]
MNPLWNELPAEIWESEAMMLSLARYFAQERIANATLLSRIATAFLAIVCRAVRYSELVLCQTSPRRTELGQLAVCHRGVVSSPCHLRFGVWQRLALVGHLKTTFKASTPFDLLVLASLHAFEHLVPRRLTQPPEPDGTYSADELAWDAINDILAWSLGNADQSALRLNEAAIERSLVLR